MTYSEFDIVETLHALGIRLGDTVFLHSALRSLGHFEARTDITNSYAAIYSAFHSALGSAGTLVVPTFNFDFCHGAEFNRDTPSKDMGKLSEYIRQRPEAMRSDHPFQSVAAIGPKAKEITEAKGRTAFGAGSPFEKMLDLNTKIVFFGIGFVVTFVHIAEERADVDYRFWKTFTGTANGEKRSVDFFARRIEDKPEPFLDIDLLEKHFLKNGIMKRQPLGEGFVSVANARELVFDLVTQFTKNKRFALAS